MKNIVLIGFMGTGKSSVGRALAKKLGREHVDIDAVIEKAEQKKIAEIFERDGEARFRELEKQAIRDIASHENRVITTGGGAVLDPENWEILAASGRVICLSASPETILERVKGGAQRPLLQGGDLAGRIRGLLEARRPFYEKADHTFQTDGCTPSQIADAIMAFLKEKQ